MQKKKSLSGGAYSTGVIIGQGALVSLFMVIKNEWERNFPKGSYGIFKVKLIHIL